MMKRAIGYVRVSTEEQAAEGVSLAAQRAKLAGYAVANELELVAIVADEGISAKRADNRPALQQALERIRAGEADALVVVKLDRLSRSTRDVLDLADESDREGWELHSLSEKLDTGSPQGRFTLTILAALAQLEREQTGERTRMALRHIRSTGRKTGGHVPFGFDAAEDGSLEENEGEARTRDLVLELAGAGMKRNAIARELNARGIPTKLGRRWTFMQVKRLLEAAEAGLAVA